MPLREAEDSNELYRTSLGQRKYARRFTAEDEKNSSRAHRRRSESLLRARASSERVVGRFEHGNAR